MKKQISLIVLLMITNFLYASQPTLKKAIPTTATSNVGQMAQYIKPGTHYNPIINAPSVPTYSSSIFANKPNIVNAAVLQRNISNVAAGSTKAAKINYYKPIEKGSYQRLSWWNNAWNYLTRQWNQIFNRRVIIEENQAVFNKILMTLRKLSSYVKDEVKEILDTHPNFDINELYVDEHSKKKVRLIDMLVIGASINPKMLPVLKYIIAKKGAAVSGRIAVGPQQELSPLGTTVVLLATHNKQAYPGAHAVFDLLLDYGAPAKDLIIEGNTTFSLIELAKKKNLSRDVIERLEKQQASVLTSHDSKAFKKMVNIFDPYTQTYGNITITKKIRKPEEKPTEKKLQYNELEESKAQEAFNKLEKAILLDNIEEVKDLLAEYPGLEINRSYTASETGQLIRLIDIAADKAIEDLDKMRNGLGMMELFIKNGVNLASNFKTEETSFLKLCLQGIKNKKPGAVAVLAFFIKNGIHVDIPISTRHGRMMPLQYAINNKFPDDVIEMIIEAGEKNK